MLHANYSLYKAMPLLGIALLFLLNNLNGQTFSKRANFDFVSVYYGVHNQPYGYQVIGRTYDSTNAPLHLVTFVRNFDFDGEELETKIYSFPNGRHLNPNHDINTRLNDSTTVYVVIDTETGNDMIYNTVVWLDNSGDTIRTKRFHSPTYQEGFPETTHFAPTAATASPDGQFIYFVSQVLSQANQNNFMIKKITALGEEVWTYIFSPTFWYYSCRSLAYFENQIWFVVDASGEQNNFNRLMRLNDDTGLPDYDIEHNGNSYPLGGQVIW